MSAQSRMSPWTAFFLGVFGLGAVTIASTSAVVLYGMRVADDNLHGVLEFAGDTLAGLPEIVDALPPAVGDLLNQRRAPAYAARIDVAARLLKDDRPEFSSKRAVRVSIQ